MALINKNTKLKSVKDLINNQEINLIINILKSIFFGEGPFEPQYVKEYSKNLSKYLQNDKKKKILVSCYITLDTINKRYKDNNKCLDIEELNLYIDKKSIKVLSNMLLDILDSLYKEDAELILSILSKIDLD